MCFFLAWPTANWEVLSHPWESPPVSCWIFCSLSLLPPLLLRSYGFLPIYWQRSISLISSLNLSQARVVETERILTKQWKLTWSVALCSRNHCCNQMMLSNTLWGVCWCIVYPKRPPSISSSSLSPQKLTNQLPIDPGYLLHVFFSLRSQLQSAELSSISNPPCNFDAISPSPG